MSVEQYQQQLSECFSGTQDPAVQGAAQQANQYTEMFKAGQISKDEFQQLMEDIANTNNINKSVANMQVLEYMNTAITGLINLSKLV
jgi:hypothetical protein